MIDVVSNISGYFDEDLENIIYKDLRTSGLSDEEVKKILSALQLLQQEIHLIEIISLKKLKRILK